MNSREKILNAIGQNKPSLVALPEVKIAYAENINLTSRFSEILTGIGGNTIIVKNYLEIKSNIQEKFGTYHRIVNQVDEVEIKNEDSLELKKPYQLEDIDLAIIKGRFGVAENGSVWVEDSDISHRVLPFICQHLIIIINEENIVSNMHDAYRFLETTSFKNLQNSSFGVFIAGPSKTADIEQSLVIGAHGARSLIVYIIKNKF